MTLPDSGSRSKKDMKNGRAKVLLIEDNRTYRFTLSKLIAAPKAPFEFETADCLRSGLAVLGQGGIDLVLLDLGLPDSQGIDTFSRIHERYQHIPIIVISAHDDDDLAIQVVNAGAQDYLVKTKTNGQLLRRAMRYAIERQRTETALRESQRLIQEIADSTPEIILLFDLREQKIVYINRQVTNLLGYTIADLQNRNLLELIHPDDHQHLDEHLENLFSDHHQGFDLTYRVKHAGGEWRWLRSDNLVFTRDAQGEPLQILSTALDVTERKLAEEATRQSEERYRDLFENANDIVYTHDLEGRFTSLNRAGELVTGYRREEGFKEGLSLIVAPEYIPLVQEMIERKLAGESQAQYEFEIITKDGARRRLEVNSRLIFKDDQPVGVQGIARDITERRQTEQRLREQAALLDCAQDAIMVRDLEGRILFWNRSAERIFGWRADEVVGKNTLDRSMPAISAQIAEAEKKVLEEGEWTGEMWQPTKDGRELIVESRWTLVQDDDGHPKSILVINTDITERKGLEAQFLRMQRLDSIGALASGIAHDLNNSLAPILMALHTLQQRFTDANSQRWLSLIRKSTERSRDLIDKVLTFAKGAEGERLPLQPSQLINDVVKILNETLPKNISLSVKVPDDLWNLIGDTTQIHQVLMNLCINARDAMPQGGTLTISAENVTTEEKQVWMTNEVAPGRFVLITVADTGIGMSPELIDRVFEPFFTTKPQGQGSGLGLSTSAGIVRSHGGIINVTSVLGRGAQFKVYLPANDVVTEYQHHPGEIVVPFGKNELILVVEDETELREITRATLEANGYRTLGACDGRDALILFQEYQDDITLVLTDLSMPNLNGLAMSQVMREINPQVKIIGTSGIYFTGKIDEFYKAGIKTVLSKPFTAVQLLKTLAVALSES